MTFIHREIKPIASVWHGAKNGEEVSSLKLEGFPQRQLMHERYEYNSYHKHVYLVRYQW